MGRRRRWLDAVADEMQQQQQQLTNGEAADLLGRLSWRVVSLP